MTATSEGTVGVSITAGHLTVSDLPPNPRIGQQIFMGSSAELAIHITSAVAQQWIDTLTPIAEGNK